MVMHKANLLLFCGSLKPPPQNPQGRSAARELLKLVREGTSIKAVKTTFLDLRDLKLPLFDGRKPEEYENSDLKLLRDVITQADAIVFSVPAYWGGVSGPMKNTLDLIGGPDYDGTIQKTPLSDKIVGLVVVGTDDNSAYNAASQMRNILSTMGAWIPSKIIVVGNPRNIVKLKGILDELRNYGFYIARIALERAHARDEL